MAHVRHIAKAMEGKGPPQITKISPLHQKLRKLPWHPLLRRLARSLVRFLAWIGLLALARTAVPRPPLVALKVMIQVAEGMSK
jgi:hypothetical protein